MIVYKRTTVSEVCLPSEVADWLMVGRVPEFMPGRYGEEERTNFDFWINRDFHLIPDPTYPEELELLGIKTDYEQYIEALFGRFSSVAELFNADDAHLPEHLKFRDQGPPTKQVIESIKEMERVNALIAPIRERAKLTVILALLEGRLKAYGYPLDEPEAHEAWQGSDWREYIAKTSAVEVPAQFWRNEEWVWSIGENEGSIPGYLAIWIKTSDALELFPKPFFEPKAISGEEHGVFMVVDGASDHRVTKQIRQPGQRGRAMKGEGAIEKAVRAEFTKRLESGALPQKSEAICQEAIEWVEWLFGEAIGRTTAQRYLKPIIDAQKDRP
ncbi:hypothetical protein [Paracoccus aminophilus]|uniref:Uncharacterized protein n=1 Tax=Paracoccus aminophilus JCM 7686 TaxID=1367847 RepID=S5XSM5_PARAH|nr:hypothetical protein [Paracoccus aminophilus]AGT08117.1 hypothetical protein JCM7686_1008 [Paracoccus aminophilus JCM 7686]